MYEEALKIQMERCTQKNVLLNEQKFGWHNKVFRLSTGQWKFLLIQQNIFLGVHVDAREKTSDYSDFQISHLNRKIFRKGVEYQIIMRRVYHVYLKKSV